MDNELKNLKLNLNQLAAISQTHRQTIVSRLHHVPLAPGSHAKNKLYYLTDVIAELIKTTPSVPAEQNPKLMTPRERKDWYDSEKSRVWLEKELRNLIPAHEVISVYAGMVKAVVQMLETLPDRLERDAALPALAVAQAQTIIDALRDELEQQTYQSCSALYEQGEEVDDGDDDDEEGN